MNILSKIKQLFCRHKNLGYYRIISKYSNIQGCTVFSYCVDCGKKLGSEFYTWDSFFNTFKKGEIDEIDNHDS